MELHLVEETALESRVEVAHQVRGGNQDAVEVLHLLQDDVLQGVVHLVDARLHVLETLHKDGVRLVEQEDGCALVLAAEATVDVEQALDVLLAVAHPLAAEFRHIDHEDVAAGLARQLEGAGGLAGARRTVEEDAEALAHTRLSKAGADAAVVLFVEQASEPADLLGLRLVVEQLLRRDGSRTHQVAVRLLLGPRNLHAFKERGSHAVGERERLGIGHAFVVDELHEAGVLQVGGAGLQAIAEH